MSLIISEIRPVKRKLFALELWKTAVFNLISGIETEVDLIYLLAISI